MSDAFRKFLRSRGRPANYSAKVLSQALAAARRKRGTEATQYAQQRAWIEANRPQSVQQVIEEERILYAQDEDAPASTPPEHAAALVEQIVLDFAREHPGQLMPIGACCHALEERGILGVDVTRAAVFQARQEARVVALGKSGPEGLYPMP
jgi:hypothetical protein